MKIKYNLPQQICGGSHESAKTNGLRALNDWPPGYTDWLSKSILPPALKLTLHYWRGRVSFGLQFRRDSAPGTGWLGVSGMKCRVVMIGNR